MNSNAELLGSLVVAVVTVGAFLLFCRVKEWWKDKRGSA